jgi:hypothetical protein
MCEKCAVTVFDRTDRVEGTNYKYLSNYSQGCGIFGVDLR